MWKYEVIWAIGYKIMAIWNFADVIWKCIGNLHLPAKKPPENLKYMGYGHQIWWKHVKTKVRKSQKKPQAFGLRQFFRIWHFPQGGPIGPPPGKIGLSAFVSKVVHKLFWGSTRILQKVSVSRSVQFLPLLPITYNIFLRGGYLFPEIISTNIH